MKKAFLLLSFLFIALSCKKTTYSPEGPTDVRIRNLTDIDFRNVIIKTSEYDEDVDTIPLIAGHATSEYSRFKKAYPKLMISADIRVDNTVQKFSNGVVDFTFMQYLSTQRVTFEIYISSLASKKLEIDELIPDEELVLKK